MGCPCQTVVISNPCNQNPGCQSELNSPAVDVCQSVAFVSQKAQEIQGKTYALSAQKAKAGAALKIKNCLFEGDKELWGSAYLNLIGNAVNYLGCLSSDRQAAFLAQLERIDGLCNCVCEFTEHDTSTGEEQDGVCNDNPCNFLTTVMEAQAIYFGLNGQFATSFSQLQLTPPNDCFTYSLITDPLNQLLHSICVAVPTAPNTGFVWLDYITEDTTPNFTSYRTFVPTIVNPGVYPTTSPFFTTTYTTGCF